MFAVSSVFHPILLLSMADRSLHVRFWVRFVSITDDPFSLSRSLFRVMHPAKRLYMPCPQNASLWS